MALAIAGAVLVHRDGETSPRYNVLVISLDTVRQDVLGCYGHRPRYAATLSTSADLDQLAREGVRMVDAYASSSWTLPSHVSLMTGLPALVHGVETDGTTLDPDIPTMAEILRQHGYRPAYGPDLVAASERAAAIRGEIGAAAAAHDWRRYDELRRSEVAVDGELHGRSEVAVTSDQVTTAAVSALESLAGADRPWFLFAHFFDVHCDYVPPPPYDTRFDPDYDAAFTGRGCMGGPAVGTPDPDRPGGLIRALADRDLEHAFALYEGEVAWVDSHVGAIMRALERLGLARRTLVVVVGDHGEEFFEHGRLGHRRTLFEEVVRAPLLLRLPGVLPAGLAVRGPVSIGDVLPTVLDVLQVSHQPASGSASFLPLIRGDDAGRDRAVVGRTVMMFSGDVEIDAGQHVTMRQILVEDAFRRGPIKITRMRSWPQFRAGLAADVSAILERESAAQYAREQLRWIDVERFPDEPEERQSAEFADPRARATLEAFRREYATLLDLRRARHPAPQLPQNMRVELEALGYVEHALGPDVPEPDVVLPVPRES